MPQKITFFGEGCHQQIPASYDHILIGIKTLKKLDAVCCPDGYKLSIGDCPIWKPNIGWEKCLRMAGEGDNIYDIGVTVAFLTPVGKDASKIPRDNDFSHRCLLFLQTRSLFWSLWLWSFCLSLPRLRICPMVSKPWQLKKNFYDTQVLLVTKAQHPAPTRRPPWTTGLCHSYWTTLAKGKDQTLQSESLADSIQIWF